MADAKDKKPPVGRPTQYKEEYVKQAYNLCLLGATNDDLARAFEVSGTTIDNWIAKHPEFIGALKAGREEADAVVAKSLYKRAIGHTVPETKVFNNQGEILTHEVEKHIPADTTAAIFWLKNRQPAKWRDRVEQKVVMSDDFDELMSADDES
ncbi:MAG: hypothetical protein ACRDA8_07860 [Shewanella sp.]